MKAVIQVVTNAKVEVEEKIVGAIDYGYLVLLGVDKQDTTVTADALLTKLLKLRINRDDKGKTNLNLQDAGGKLLIVSQFTLCADLSRGNRPSFNGADPKLAQDLYNYICAQAAKIVPVQTGEFGAEMMVSFTNCGPSTYLLEI